MGESGQRKTIDVASLAEAETTFAKKFAEKTGNAWGQPFQARRGKYAVLERAYAVEPDAATAVSAAAPLCSLPAEVATLLQLICDERTMRDMLATLEYDVRAPLGALRAETLAAGAAKLAELEAAVAAHASQDELRRLSSEYYTLVPHAFGRRTPPVIGSAKAITAESTLLEALRNVQVATARASSVPVGVHPVDHFYAALDATITPVTDAATLAVLREAVSTTHATTPPHNRYSLRIAGLYAIQRHEDERRFAPYAGAPNRQLLWHGSRLGNWAGILSAGLKIAPPEAPSTGAMFGRGLCMERGEDGGSREATVSFPLAQTLPTLCPSRPTTALRTRATGAACCC